MNESKFTNNYLKAIFYGAELSQIMAAAIRAVNAESAIKAHLKLENNRLAVGEKSFDLRQINRIFVVGAGKAGAAMAKAVDEILGERITAGLVMVKAGHAEKSIYGKIEIIEAAHPVPDKRGVEGSKKLQKLLTNLTADDLVLVLISGGGSAVSTLPAEDIKPADVQNLTNELLKCGATISEINCLRKHLTVLSGGGLAQIAFPAQVCSLIISDVVGSPLDVIASGMTAPDSTYFADAWAILEKYELTDKVADSIINRLQKGLRGEIADTPKADSEIWQNVVNFIVADNQTASDSAKEKARELGFEVQVLTNSLEGEAREVSKIITKIAKEKSAENFKKSFLLIAGGETTVTIRGNGKGGRNQELALGAVEDLAGLENVILATLATDGGDATDAVGAIADGRTLANALAKGINPAEYLARNDSYNFFEPLGALFKTGATLTNVNDLLFLLITPKSQ